MIVQTKKFGELQIEEDKIITFEKGIPGFENFKKYILIFEEENSPFCWLQCIDDAKVAFVLINPLVFYKDYNPEVKEEYVLKLGEPKVEDLAVYAVLVIPENIKNMTVNLKAPIIINTKTQKGMQIITDNENYKIRHNIYEELIKNKKDGE